MSGILICACNKADLSVCEVCPKYKTIKPNRLVNIPTWKLRQIDEKSNTFLVNG